MSLRHLPLVSVQTAAKLFHSDSAQTVTHRQNGDRKLLPHHHYPWQKWLESRDFTVRPAKHAVKRKNPNKIVPTLLTRAHNAVHEGYRGACRYSAAGLGCGGGCRRSAASLEESRDDVPAKQHHTHTYRHGHYFRLAPFSSELCVNKRSNHLEIFLMCIHLKNLYEHIRMQTFVLGSKTGGDP